VYCHQPPDLDQAVSSENASCSTATHQEGHHGETTILDLLDLQLLESLRVVSKAQRVEGPAGVEAVQATEDAALKLADARAVASWALARAPVSKFKFSVGFARQRRQCGRERDKPNSKASRDFEGNCRHRRTLQAPVVLSRANQASLDGDNEDQGQRVVDDRPWDREVVQGATVEHLRAGLEPGAPLDVRTVGLTNQVKTVNNRRP
jgi:hypothetical protein